MICIIKELGYREIDTVWYSDPTLGMHVLADDKGALDIEDLCKVHLSIYVYIQHSLSHKFYDGPLE